MSDPQKDVSRREFIIGSGAIVAGFVIPGVSAIEAPAENLIDRPVTVETLVPPAIPAASTNYLVVDSKKCAGCLTCMFTCSTVHEGVASLSTSRIQITQNSLQAFPYDLTMNQCRQCTDPLCVNNCPTGACKVDAANGNLRDIDPTKCIGCQTCMKLCPHPPHRTVWDAVAKKALKCDLCVNATYFNKPVAPKPQQACVLVCPMSAISVVKQVPDQTDDRGYDVNLRKA